MAPSPLLPGAGSGPSTGSGWPSTGGPAQGVPIISVGGSGGGLPISGSPAAQTVSYSSGCSFWQWLSNPVSCGGTAIGNQLLRLALFIIGLLCIAGAIYLYKPTNQMIVQPVKGALKAGTEVGTTVAE